MSLYDYRKARDLQGQDTPVAALLMAAMLRGDTDHVNRLRLAFPELYQELTDRYHAPAGLLPVERAQLEKAAADFPAE